MQARLPWLSAYLGHREPRYTYRYLTAVPAMQLHAGIDTSVIALWLGCEDIRSTQAYLHASLAIKERALERTAPARCPVQPKTLSTTP